MSDELNSETNNTEAAGETVAVEANQSKPETVKTEGRNEIENKIIARHNGNLKQEPKSETIVKEEPPKVENTKVETQQQSVITEDDVKDIPALKSLIGKPFSELSKAYANLNKLAGQREAELSKLKNQKQETVKDEIKKPEQIDTKSLEQQVNELIKNTKIPDSIDDPEGNKVEMVKLAVKIMQLENEAKSKTVQDKLDELGKDKEAQRQQNELQSQINKTVSLVKQYVGDDTINIDELQKEYVNSDVVKELLEGDPTYYNGKPELLASDLARYHTSKGTLSLKEQKEELEKKINELNEVIKTTPKGNTVADLKKKIDNAPDGHTKQTVVHKEKVLSAREQMEEKIIKRHNGEG